MKLFSALFVVSVLFVAAFDSSAQNYLDDKEIEGRVARLLQTRDVGELANELAQDKSALTTEDLLIRLSVYARAGHRARLHDALGEIGRIDPASPDRDRIFRVVRRAVSDDDLAAQKIFYEEFAVNGDDRAGYFIDAWRREGNVRELENWLKARAETSEIWWEHLLLLKKSLKTSNELVDALAQKIRANPADYSLVKKYLRAASTEVNVSSGIISPINVYGIFYNHDVSWLAETVKTESAYEAFDLAIRLRRDYPSAAVKLLDKSLSIPFTERDAQLFGEQYYRGAAESSAVKNPEKQLRVWTKKALVEIYQETKQPMLAQPLVEELTAMDLRDIDPGNTFYSAGAVQSSTGLRVVETKLLKDEKTNENSPEYWFNRAAYYDGRNEEAQVWKTYRLALERFSYKPNDLPASFPRLQILYRLSSRGSDDPQTVETLRGEFIRARAKNDSKYLFMLLRAIKDEFDALRDEFFVNTELLPQILAVRREWNYDESYAIGDVMESEKWDAKKRAFVWDKLTELAKQDVARRALHLADAMTGESENSKAVPLLEECLKIAPLEITGGAINFTRAEIKSELFDIFITLGDWQKAGKLYANDEDFDANNLSKVAILAAKNGKPAEAVRLWKIIANLDRRNLNELPELAKTDAKKPLREFYMQMKQNDSLTDAPDKALLFLQ